MKKIILGIAAFFLSACSYFSSSHWVQLQKADSSLPLDSSWYVAQSADGFHDHRREVASGVLVSKLLAASLRAHVHAVATGVREESFSVALESARRSGAAYLAFASILDWENEATPMASVPDKVEVKIEVVDVVSGAVIDAALLQKETSFFATDKVPPQELLRSPLSDYVGALFQAQKPAPTEAANPADNI